MDNEIQSDTTPRDAKNRRANVENTVEGSEEKKSAFSKDHVNYWKNRLRQQRYGSKQKGTYRELPALYARIYYRGQAHAFTFTTLNKNKAAIEAKDIYTEVKRDGWDSVLKRHRAESQRPSDNPTIGEFLNAVKAISSHIRPETFEIYARKFRTLVAGVFGVKGGTAKHDHVKGGYQKWLERISRIRLRRLTSARIERWKLKYLQDATANPLKLKQAQTTILSILRSSKSLFSRKILPSLKTISMPDPLPFEGVQLPKRRRSRYKSVFKSGYTPQLLALNAKKALANTEPEIYKIILLALGAGLRRDEIDSLTWNQIDLVNSTIRVETNQYTRAKSEDSEDDIDVDPDLLEIIKGYKQQSRSQFVIESAVKPRPEAHSYHHYRLHALFRSANDWLRKRGMINTRCPLHTLRKQFGSEICAQAGIFAASAALRHSSIQLTRDTYVEKQKPTIFAIGKTLRNSELKDAPEEKDRGAELA